MSHGFDEQIAQAADDSLAAEARLALDAHLATCEPCRASLSRQREARAILMARPIMPVRDLSAAIRAQLEAEQSWIDRLNINWRMWSLRVAPIAAALMVIAVMTVRSVDTATTTAATETVATTAAADTSTPVVSALWSDGVSDDALLTLFLRAKPDDELSNYATDIQNAKGK